MKKVVYLTLIKVLLLCVLCPHVTGTTAIMPMLGPDTLTMDIKALSELEIQAIFNSLPIIDSLDVEKNLNKEEHIEESV